MQSSPGVILKSRFVFSKKKFTEYINYIDRPEAVRGNAYEKFSVYTDYMDNGKKCTPGFNNEADKTSALFTATKDKLSLEEKQALKAQFCKAQKNDSPMWQQVISFTNEFLEEHGLYDSRSKMLDEDKIRTVTRLAIAEMLHDEHMDGAAVWSAAIHYNTDNIHVHIAIVEPAPTRKKKEFIDKKSGNKKEQFVGSIKKTTFGKMKSKVVNNIVDRSPELQKINGIIRDNIVTVKRGRSSYRDKKLRGMFLNLYRTLPDDRRLWFYNMNALSSVRPEIDRFTKAYISMYHKQDFEELTRKLNEQQEFLRSVYGTGKEELYKNYSKTKIKDLYTRMGNAVLRELRNYDKKIYPRHIKKKAEKGATKYRGSSALYNLKKALKKDYGSAKNQIEFERLQQDIETEYGNER